MKLKWLSFLFLLMFILACQQSTSTIEKFNGALEKIRSTYVTDPSLKILSAQLSFSDKRYVLSGETTDKGAYDALLALADSLIGKGKWENRLILLPHPALGDSTRAIVQVSVANLREEPRHAAQLVDQNIMGRTLRLLKNEGGWYLVQTEYQYIGWMRRESFYRTDSVGLQKWLNLPKVRVTAVFAIVRQRPDPYAIPVTDVVMNVLLIDKGRKGNWWYVQTPDGRNGYIESKNVTTEIVPRISADKIRMEIVRTARKMMGFPYLWGGNSSEASDCSGFTQTVFKANGIDLPRDARQQALIGVEIKPEVDFSNVFPGDLLFFGSPEKITHVAISLGGMEYIHQSGRVHINSFNPQSKVFNAYRKKTLQKIRRVL